MYIFCQVLEKKKGSKVEQSFRDFLKSDPVLPEMAMGLSRPQLEFEISWPLAYTLNLITGHALRARALIWFTGEGLLEASMGREKLREIVNQQLNAKGNILSLPQTPKNIQPSGKVVGMANEVRADHVYNTFGEDPDDDGEVQSGDLFSPEAYQRRPELASLKIDGKSIPEYYEEHFEPKVMVLEYAPGKYKRFNLSALREAVENMGLPSFRYGGFDGYLQYMEKGDYLPTQHKRTFSRNQQMGPDLRPQISYDKSGNETDPDELFSVDRRGNPIINFMGGSVSFDNERANQTIDDMRREFANIATKIQTNQKTNLPPEQEESLRNLFKNQSIKNVELGGEGDSAGRAGLARTLNLPDSVRSSVKVALPDGVDPKEIFGAVNKGLTLPRVSGIQYWGDPTAFGPEWDGTGPEPDGWHRIEGNKLTYKFNAEQRKNILNYILRDFPTTGHYTNKLRAGTPVNGESGGGVPEAKPTKDQLIYFTQLLNAGRKASPEFKTTKQQLFQLGGVDPKRFVSDQGFEKKEVDPTNPSDPVLSGLTNSGYKWELMTPRERELGHPDFLKRGYGILSLKGSRFKVERDDNDGKFYLHVPIDKDGKPFKPAARGAIGTAMLGGGARFSGGLGGGHIAFNPAGKKTWKQLLSMLMQGGLGEKGSADNEFEISSIRDAVNSARNYFDNKKGPKASYKDFETDYELAEWGLEALKGFSGDPAFQIGYVSKEEIENLLKWDPDQQYQAELLEPGKGKGINALLHRHTELDPDLHGPIIQDVLQRVGKHPIIDISDWDEPIRKAFYENGYKARVRFMTNAILARMLKKVKDEGGNNRAVTFGSMSKPDGEGSGSVDFGTKAQVRSRGEWEDDPKDVKVMTAADVRKLAGVQNPEILPDMIAKPKKPTLGVQQPVPTPDRPAPMPDNPFINMLTQAIGPSTQKPKSTAQAPRPVPPAQAASAAPAMNFMDLLGQELSKSSQPKSIPQTAPQPKPIAPDQGMSFMDLLAKQLREAEIFRSYSIWKKLRETEMVFDPKVKVKDGCGFNYEGAPGTVAVSASGEADTAKTDPTGQKGIKRGRKR